MGMPITVEIIDPFVIEAVFDNVFAYFDYVDKKFSTYKDGSEISRINSGETQEKDYSPDMAEVLRLCEETKKQSSGLILRAARLPRVSCLLFLQLLRRRALRASRAAARKGFGAPR